MSFDVYDVAAATILTMSGGNGNLLPGADWLRKQYIVIDRVDLPEVTTSKTKNGYTVVHAGEWTFDHHPDDVPTVESAKAYLAAALWFEANPPVDEAQVKALRDLYFSWAKSDEDFGEYFARRGVRMEVDES